MRRWHRGSRGCSTRTGCGMKSLTRGAHFEVMGALEGDGLEVEHGGIATSQKTAELTTAIPVDQEAKRSVEYTCDAGPDNNDEEDSSNHRKSSDGSTVQQNYRMLENIFFFKGTMFITRVSKYVHATVRKQTWRNRFFRDFVLRNKRVALIAAGRGCRNLV